MTAAAPYSTTAEAAAGAGDRPGSLPLSKSSQDVKLSSAAAAATQEDTHDESPEKLSLKARLKLFEKEIEQQGSAAPAPKQGTLEIRIKSYQG